MRILVTGGAGYIGSHTCVVLAERGHDVVIADNFATSSAQVVPRLSRLVGRPLEVDRVDLRDFAALDRLLTRRRIDAVVHFAALKAVGESCADPLRYFDNNLCGTIGLLRAMQRHGVQRLVFSSSATVYGAPDRVPVREDAGLRVTNPYGRTKLVMEQLIGDVQRAAPELRAASLRYFNPVGAHASGLIGEDPVGVPNNLMPYLCQVATGRRDRLRVFGDDYPTVDGTGVRDYLHVCDLAHAHADALDALDTMADGEAPLAVNLGTGRGVSVLELVRAFERACGRAIPLEMVERRAGDVAAVYADPSLAMQRLGWRATLDLDAMCRDAWRWQSLNPDGYATAHSAPRRQPRRRGPELPSPAHA